MLKVEGLSFSYQKQTLFSEVTFSLNRGEALGLMGDSGCGKSTLAKCLLKLEQASSGKMFFEGQDLFKLSGKSLRKFRKDVQIVFQDTETTLDPSWIVYFLIEEPLTVFFPKLNQSERKERVFSLMKNLGLNENLAERLPKELSGGQRQRVAIARALATEPKLLILDESFNQLDMTIQSELLTYLIQLQEESGISYLFISHDSDLTKQFCHRTLRLQGGRIQ